MVKSIFLGAVAIALTASGGPKRNAAAPAWMDYSLAGYGLEYDDNHLPIGVFDKAKGFYLIRSIDCDGAVITLTLTHDRHVVVDGGYDVPGFDEQSGNPERALKTRTLPSLATGKGVRIGDPPRQMVKLLGKPSRSEVSGSRGQFSDEIYSWKSRSGTLFEETYTFKQGKLIEISFCRMMNPDD